MIIQKVDILMSSNGENKDYPENRIILMMINIMAISLIGKCSNTLTYFQVILFFITFSVLNNLITRKDRCALVSK